MPDDYPDEEGLAVLRDNARRACTPETLKADIREFMAELKWHGTAEVDQRRLVLDIGRRVLKAAFAWEASERAHEETKRRLEVLEHENKKDDDAWSLNSAPRKRTRNLVRRLLLAWDEDNWSICDEMRAELEEIVGYKKWREIGVPKARAMHVAALASQPGAKEETK